MARGGLAALLVTLTLWSARDLHAVGVFAPNTNALINLYLGNNPHTPLVHSYRAMNDSLVWEPLRGLGEAERARASLRLATAEVRARPGRALLRAALRLPDALEFDRTLLGVAKNGQFPERAGAWLVWIGALVALATTLPLALVVAMVFAPGSSAVARAGRGAFVALLLVQMASIAHSRFTLPLGVALLPGAAQLGERVLAGEPSARRALWIAAAVLAVVFAREILIR